MSDALLAHGITLRIDVFACVLAAMALWEVLVPRCSRLDAMLWMPFGGGQR